MRPKSGKRPRHRWLLQRYRRILPTRAKFRVRWKSAQLSPLRAEQIVTLDSNDEASDASSNDIKVIKHLKRGEEVAIKPLPKYQFNGSSMRVTKRVAELSSRPENKLELDFDTIVDLIDEQTEHAEKIGEQLFEIEELRRCILKNETPKKVKKPEFVYTCSPSSEAVDLEEDTAKPYSAADISPKVKAPDFSRDSDEDIDKNWPPEHYAKKFWAWCQRDFLRPIDEQVVDEFREAFVDPFSADKTEPLFANEPWKHRPHTRKIRKARNFKKLDHHRTSLISQNGQKNDDLTNVVHHSLHGSFFKSDNGSRLIQDVIQAYVIDKTTESPAESDNESNSAQLNGTPNGNSNGYSNGIATNGCANGELESTDSEEENDAPSQKSKQNSQVKTMAQATRKRRETVEDCAEGIKRDALEAAGRSVADALAQTGKTERDRHNILISSLLLDNLLPPIDETGRTAGDDMDEVSEKLLTAQRELAVALPEYRRTSNAAFEAVQSEFVIQSIRSDLDKLDTVLFETGAKCYAENPRRIATQTDMAFLTPRLHMRERKASELFGHNYAPAKWKYVTNLKLMKGTPFDYMTTKPKGIDLRPRYELADEDFESEPEWEQDDESVVDLTGEQENPFRVRKAKRIRLATASPTSSSSSSSSSSSASSESSSETSSESSSDSDVQIIEPSDDDDDDDDGDDDEVEVIAHIVRAKTNPTRSEEASEPSEEHCSIRGEGSAEDDSECMLTPVRLQKQFEDSDGSGHDLRTFAKEKREIQLQMAKSRAESRAKLRIERRSPPVYKHATRRIKVRDLERDSSSSEDAAPSVIVEEPSTSSRGKSGHNLRPVTSADLKKKKLRRSQRVIEYESDSE